MATGAGRGSRVARVLDWWMLAVVGAVIPVVVAVVDRLGSDWQPGSDDAAIARLSHDVLSGNTPLLGMPSTIGNGVKVTGGGVPHHLGPMLFWLFAIPDRLSGSAPDSLVVTIALVNVVCIAAVAWIVARQAGRLAAIAAMLGVTVLIWSLGRDLTVQIWNPYAAFFPFLLLLVLAWSVALGRHRAVPVAALVGSFVMQCHVLYVTPVVVVAIAAIAGLVLADRRVRAAGDDAPQWRTRRRHALFATGCVLAACWCTAAYDQLFHRGGNLTRLWDSFHGSHIPPVGVPIGLRYVLRALAVPPLFARHVPSFEANSAISAPLSVWALLSALAVLAVLVAATVVAVRQGRSDARLGIVAFVATLAALLVVARLPVEFGGITTYRDRFLWVVGLYVWLAIVVLLGRPLVDRVRAARPGRAARASVAIAAALALLTVVSGAAAATQRSPAYSVPPDDGRVISDLTAQVRAHVTYRGPYLIDMGGSRAFGSVGFGVMWDLVRHGYDIRVLAGDPYLGAKHGLPRRAKVPHLVVVSAGLAYRPPAGWRRVAFLDTSPGLAPRIARAEAAILAAVERRAPALNANGRAALARVKDRAIAGAMRSLLAPNPPWRRLLELHLLRVLEITGFVDMPPGETALLVRYDDLLDESVDTRFSVFVGPPPT